MATVQVSLDGPSKAVVESRLDEIAQGAGVDRHPLSATATFTAGGPLATYGMTTSLHGPSKMLSYGHSSSRSKMRT